MAYDVGKRPGEWVSEQAVRRQRHVWLIVVGVVLVLVAVLALMLSRRLTVVSAGFGLVCIVALRRYGDRIVGDAIRWRRGAAAEQAVGMELERLRADGFVLMHDIEQRGEGNVDHLLSGPSGVFMVETKARRYEEPQLKKARRQAAKLASELGVWVTPVICLHEREGRPYKHAGVWIVPRAGLFEWIRRQRQPALEFEALARFADRV